MTEGQKVKWNGRTAEVVKVYKNGRCKIAFWVQTFGMTKPELWNETVPCKSLEAA